MRLLVDMDAVIAQWGAEFDRCLDRAGSAAVNIPRSIDQKDWDLKKGLGPRQAKIVDRIMQEPGFYTRLEPIDGAKEALKAAVKDGHYVRIVSAPYISNPTCASDKIDWIARHYGSHWASRLILTNDKTVVHGDFLIDDKPVIKGSMTPTWRRVIFGDYPYNRHVNGLRITRWSAGSIPSLEGFE